MTWVLYPSARGSVVHGGFVIASSPFVLDTLPVTSLMIDTLSQ
jgi:hypothetical protein